MRRWFRPRLIITILSLILLLVMLNGGPSARQDAIARAVAQGDSALGEGQITQALSAYQRALSLQPGTVALLDRMYQAAVAANRPDLAASYLDRQAALTGWTPELLRRMAKLRIAESDSRAAAVFYRASLTGRIEDIAPLRFLADNALSDRDWPAAIDSLEKLLRLIPQDSRALLSLGLLLAPTNQVRALDLLTRAGKSAQTIAQNIDETYKAYGSDSRASLSFRLGLVMLDAGKYAYAEYALEDAVAQGSSTPAVLAFLGIAQDEQGHDGWTAISKALELAPDDATVNYAAGLHWRLNGDSDRALQSLRYAWALQSSNPAIAAEIGLTYRAERMIPDAAQWLIRAVSLAPENVGFQRLLAIFIADEAYDLDGIGLPMLRSLAQRTSTDADIQASLGWANIALKQYDDAQKALQAALNIDPTNPRAMYYWGVLLEVKGDGVGALDAYTSVYSDDRGSGFRDRAGRAMLRLGYKPEPGLLLQSSQR